MEMVESKENLNLAKDILPKIVIFSRSEPALVYVAYPTQILTKHWNFMIKKNKFSCEH